MGPLASDRGPTGLLCAVAWNTCYRTSPSPRADASLFFLGARHAVTGLIAIARRTSSLRRFSACTGEKAASMVPDNLATHGTCRRVSHRDTAEYGERAEQYSSDPRFGFGLCGLLLGWLMSRPRANSSPRPGLGPRHGRDAMQRVAGKPKSNGATASHVASGRVRRPMKPVFGGTCGDTRPVTAGYLPEQHFASAELQTPISPAGVSTVARLLCVSCIEGILGHAADPVTAHLRLTLIRLEQAHLQIALSRILRCK